MLPPSQRSAISMPFSLGYLVLLCSIVDTIRLIYILWGYVCNILGYQK